MILYLTNVEVVSVPNYRPKLITNFGKILPQEITFNVYSPEHKEQLELLAWGKRADLLATECSMGRKLEVKANKCIHEDRVVLVIEMLVLGREVWMDPDTTRWIGYDPLLPSLGPSTEQFKEALKVLGEKRAKERKAGWDRKSDTFGYAKVVVPTLISTNN